MTVEGHDTQTSSADPTAPAASGGDQPSSPPASSRAEPQAEPESVTETDKLYLSPPSESFADKKVRIERQETLLFRNNDSYGPQQSVPARPSPYSRTTDGEPEEALHTTLDVDLLRHQGLPAGWVLENGYLSLGDTHDEWSLTGNYLIRHHYLGRQQEFIPTVENCPIPLNYFSKQRITTLEDGRQYRDKWTRNSGYIQLRRFSWTGTTKLRLHPAWKKQAHELFAERSKGLETIYLQENPTPEKAPGTVNERTLNVEDRLKFLEAKRKEISSFFENEVWTFDEESNADPNRILRAKFILNWKKGEGTEMRAKARLICQGFKDPDALTGVLTTASPTLTRLSRSFVMAIAPMLGYTPFTADITTAFLQGRKYEPDSPRILWVKVPRDAEHLLGLTPGHGKIMKLTKPMYGLVDAPKAWYDEAVSRILKMGKGAIIQHPLDSCLFLAYDRVIPSDRSQEGTELPRLLSIFGIHVDDLFGCHNDDDPKTADFLSQLKSIFKFREWHSGRDHKELTYCGAKITPLDDQGGWKIGHEDFFKKQKPITVAPNREASDEVTEKERTALRGLLGALQWPSTQTAPHLQAHISLLAGEISKATVSTLEEANKALRYAKVNADVCLEYRCLGKPEDMAFVAFSDASFACRSDLSSQGGFILMMVHKDVANGAPGQGISGHYNVLDWRSWKLARVCRSTLAAESQAASEAADALLFTTTFWNLIWRPWLPLDDVRTARVPTKPRLIIDAKALYDLLARPQIQATSNSDKRTMIEALVTQDKLSCCEGTTLWVSSENQWADGLTKQSAAQLLADRLRTHEVALKSDTSFQASKKKTPQERRRNQEMFAAKKPQRALYALMASMLTAAVAAEEQGPNTTNYTYFDIHFNGIYAYVLVTLLTLFLGMCFLSQLRPFGEILDRRAEGETSRGTSIPATPPAEKHSTSTQTTMTLLSLERLEAQETELRTTIALMAQDHQRELDDLELKHGQTVFELGHYHGTELAERDRLITRMTQKPIFCTPRGRCWHTDRACLARCQALEQNVMEKDYCTKCSHLWRLE